MYDMEDPLLCLQCDPPNKTSYKNYYKTKIIIFHEKELRLKSINNSSMFYLNVAMTGLNGRAHPAICDMLTGCDVDRARPHIKMLTGDYLTYKKKSIRCGGSSLCPLCLPQEFEDTLTHILMSHITEKRQSILNQIEILCYQSTSCVNFKNILYNKEEVTQFILDPTSVNLTSKINYSDPILPEIIKKCRDYCFVTDKERMESLNLMKSQGKYSV